MYEVTQLFWYKSVFMAEILAAEFLFTFRLKKKDRYPLRFALAALLCMAVSVAAPILGYNALCSSVLFFALFAVSVGALMLCFREPFLHIFFCAVAAYTVQHIAFELYNFIVVVTGLNAGLPVEVYGESAARLSGLFLTLVYVDSYCIVYWLMTITFGSMIRKNEDLRIRSTSMLVLVALVVLVDIVISAVVTYYSYEHNNSFYVSVTSVYNILCCLLALYVQFSLLSKRQLERELDTVNSLYEQEKKQYDMFKENLDFINVKCHDLRHQIRQIGRSSSLDEASIREMEDVISIYDSAVETGNKTIDIILTEKSLMCNKNHIQLTCIVDGGEMSFMAEQDIYSLFGNAIDNAVEALSQVEDEEKRVVGIIAKRKGMFVSLQFYNYCSQTPQFSGGLPVTTKADKQYHGFGMKSIRMIAQKYGGEMDVSVENQVFNLRLLFPLE